MKKIYDPRTESRNYFNSIANDYGESFDGRFVLCLYDEVLNRVSLLEKPEAILDIGCGNGALTALILEKTDARLYGLDLSEAMIREAVMRLGERAAFIVGDAHCLPYGNGMFDAVICNASFHHYVNPVAVLREVKRVLKPGGIFVLGDPTAPFPFLRLLNRVIAYRNSGDLHLYGKKEITAMLEREGFVISGWKRLKMRAFILDAALPAASAGGA